jgi:hypothetical protein
MLRFIHYTQLPAADGGKDVAHTIVVADLRVLAVGAGSRAWVESLRAGSIHPECALSIAERNGQNLVQSCFERRLRIALAAEMLVMWEIGEVGVVWGVIPTRL